MTQGEALEVLKTGANVFLTGEPGSGKTHTVNTYISWLHSCGIDPAKTAATGIAATHIGGVTIHAWSGIGVRHTLSPSDLDQIASREYLVKRIQKTKVLIIEEVSMLSKNTFEMVDSVTREVRRIDKPFGGLTVVLVGDFFQLPPVSRSIQEQFAYESRVWNALNPITCYLETQFRQDDASYLDLLTAVRKNEVHTKHVALLESRQTILEDIDPTLPKLFSHTVDVDSYNTEALADLSGQPHLFLMRSKGKEVLVESLKRGCLSPEQLALKVGASVMFTKNSSQGKYVNGSLGTVESFDALGMPIVSLKNGSRVSVEPAEWQIEEDGKIKASVTQIPLRLAYAITIHKSQGMSMDGAVVDLSKAFAYGQGYVALSRVRRLSGLHLVGFNSRALEVDPLILEKDREFRAQSEAAQKAFTEMTDAEKQKLTEQFVTAIGGVLNASSSKNAGDSAIPARLTETLRVVRSGKSLAKIAKERGLTEGTIIKHLEDLQSLGALTHEDIAALVPTKSTHDKILLLLEKHGDKTLTPIFKAGNGAFSYDAIRLSRLAFRLGLPL